jgi:DNA-binding helix-hairpin-helix protein with protein kinase domain
MSTPAALPPVANGANVRLLWPDGRSEKARLVAIGRSGGAGEVFSLADDPRYVAKIYHASIAAPQRARYEAKIGWMIRNRPELPPIPADYQGIVQLAWPLAVVLQGSRFAGFLMEKIDFERTLELDYLLTRRQAAREGFAVDFGKLVTICHNLATLIDCLHGKRISVVDLKPINLKVYKSELYVSILDCDGFHIQSDGFVSEAPQVTPEYLAPEFQDKSVTRPESQDRFALATIIFRLLNYGIHPFTGVAAARRPYPAELAGRIQQGLYPYGLRPLAGMRATPASVHSCFPPAIRAYFDAAFAAGTASRPSARDWAGLLGEYANRNAAMLLPCPRGHLQFAGLACAVCLREGILRGHVERRRRLVTRIQASPARAISYVRKSFKGTRTSPFQAALAQAQGTTVQMAPPAPALRTVLAVEIVWAIGLLITVWWLK